MAKAFWKTEVVSSKSVCIVAPLGNDASSIASVLTAGGLSPVIFHTLDDLAVALGDDVGAVMMTDEALTGDVECLRLALGRQHSWSDIPFILLRATRAGLRGRRLAMPPEVVNLIELERPLGSASLLSAARSALRARLKQFVIRDQMARLEESQAALAESEAELRLVADTAPGLIAFIDTGLAYRFANLAHEEWFGVPVQDIVGKRVAQVLGPQGWREQKDNIDLALSGQAVHVEVLWPTAEGRRRYAEVRYLPRFDAAGQVDGFHAFASDITVRRVALETTRHQAALLESRVAERTDELRREMAARKESEAALRQAQKMEAVGQLTGGIAHDFNNMLTGILAAMELLRARVDDGKLDGISRLVDIASTSAQRAAGLTQRLLAFSRRQSLDPRPVDVPALVESMEDLFTRTLGERVRLRTSFAAEVPPAMVDANQLESALLNLVINARDAMPDGGEVEVHTSLQHLPDENGITTGAIPYVLLGVSDTGVGMDDETLSRVFEPFFTTKPIGQGTGLGMSMIYGFINQSNGHVRIECRLRGKARPSVFTCRWPARRPSVLPTPLPCPSGAAGKPF
jgi:PAS domain S-box-containing protein